jgi:acetolactate synthase-1/3 small subunit
MERHVLSALVRNHPGVLFRVAGLFSRRGYNIESLTVGETEVADYSRMTIAVRGDDAVLEQIQKQLEKLVEVISVRLLDPTAAVCRELALIKVVASESNREDVIRLAAVFRASVVDISPESLVVEATGDSSVIDSLVELLKPHGIRELARTGISALERGPVSLPVVLAHI